MPVEQAMTLGLLEAAMTVHLDRVERGLEAGEFDLAEVDVRRGEVFQDAALVLWARDRDHARLRRQHPRQRVLRRDRPLGAGGPGEQIDQGPVGRQVLCRELWDEATGVVVLGECRGRCHRT